MSGMFDIGDDLATAGVLHQAVEVARASLAPPRSCLFAGLDPGKKGCLAVVDLSAAPRVVMLEPWPVLDGKGFSYDLPSVWEMLRRLKAMGVAGSVIEQQQAHPKQGASSNYTIGCGFGMLAMGMTAAGVPYEVVHPSTWKRDMGIKGQGKTPAERKKDTKRRSIAKAQAMFPGQSLLPTPRSRKPSDGLAEALLLAAYAGRHRV